MKETDILIKEDNRPRFVITCDPTKPIKDLKERIKNEHGIPVYCQKLFYNHTELSDYKKLGDYNIKVKEIINSTKELLEDLELINMDNLAVNLQIKNIKLKYHLKASDTILNLKKLVYEKENIPIDKIQILKFGNIIDDNKIIEDYMPDLYFEGRLQQIEKIKINIINDKSIESLLVDPFSNISDIKCQLKKNYDFRLEYKGNYLENNKLLIQYKIKDDDNIKLIKYEDKKITLKIRFNPGKNLDVNVYLNQKVYELKELIGIGDNYDLIFKGRLLHTYENLSDLHIKDGNTIIAVEEMLGG